MAEYIERAAIKYEMWAVSPVNKSPLMVVRKCNVDKIPAAEVELVRHGQWQRLCPDRGPFCRKYRYQCCICRGVTDAVSHYCPNCGAKMDGGEQA